MGSLSIWHWLIVLLVVVLIFGTKKLRNIGSDVGGAVKSFKDAMNEEKKAPEVEGVVETAVAPVQESQLIAATEAEIPVAKAPAKKRAPSTKKATAAKTTATKSTAAKAPAKPKTAAAKKTTAKKTAATAKKSES